MPRNSTFLTELGPGGLSSLSLAFASGLVALGAPVGFRLRQVLRAAATDERRAADAILVLGRELVDDRPTPVFRARLDHGAALWREGLAPVLLVSGGWTGTASRSEAAAGRDYLIEAGIPVAAIETEERSRHTLENLCFVRESLRARGLGRVVLVSDPLHLARAAALARGLALDFSCSPAATAPPRRGAPDWWARALREAFLLHWYHVGVAYSRAIGSERLLARVT
jgi:uncharacterized SAM-binding protein YcdF (DUF218 family)